MEHYVTAGEFAKLATTTKRTIHYYDEKGVLEPAKIGDNRYRLYHERQILEYQMILLLSNLGVTLSDMKKYIKKMVIYRLYLMKKKS